MNKQQLANKIWESANKMRAKIEANEYKDYILGFIFYKFLSDNQVAFLHRNGMTDEEMQESLVESDEDTLRFVQENVGYFIAYTDLFSTWIKKGKDFDISNVTDALSAFGRLIYPSHKKVFEGIFNTLETGLSKLGDSAASRSKAIRDLLYLIKDIPMTGKQDYDVLGFIYEYLIGMFAANAGKKAGEFYTPHEVSLLMSDIVAEHLKAKGEIQIYDPTSGSGSLLINIGRSVSKHMDKADRIKYYAQELKQNTYNLTRMNLVMRGIKPSNIVTRNADTLEDDWPYFDENDKENTYEPLYVDAVVSNPPYSQNWDPEGKENSPRFARFGLAPKSKADYAFLLHDLYHIKPDGIMTIVLPHGVLFRGGEEGTIRKNLIEFNHIDAIIGLPANIFFGTGIPTIIMVLKQRRSGNDVLIIDASKGFEKVGKSNKLRASDIRRITDVLKLRQDVPKFAKVVSRTEIRENDYNLNIPRYVDSSPDPETWDIYASMFGGIPAHEIDSLFLYWDNLPGLKEMLFKMVAPDYFDIAPIALLEAIEEHPAVKEFYHQYQTAFGDWPKYLYNILIDQMEAISLTGTEALLSSDLFSRIAPVSMLDPYEAFQLFDNAWQDIAVDLEIIQTEGFETIRMVDPRMVMKKVGGQEQEVQDGWQGRILPFTLVQSTYLTEELLAIQVKEDRIASISSSYEDFLEDIPEDERGTAEFNDANDAFNFVAVSKKAKELSKDGSDYPVGSYEAVIIQVADLLVEEKALKAQLKKDQEALHLLTKTTIEELTDEQARELLDQKWIYPLVSNVGEMKSRLINDLAAKIQALADKYATTLADVEADIISTEASLVDLLSQLVAGDADQKGLNELRSLLAGGSHA